MLLFGCLRLLNVEYLIKIIANLLVISIIEFKSTFGYSVSTSIIEKKVPMATLIQVPTVIYFSENSHAYNN